MYTDILNYSVSSVSDYFGVSAVTAQIMIAVAALWILIWKAVALWKAGRLNQPIWFVALFVINSLAILDILYIFAFSKIKLENMERNKKGKKRKNAV